MKILLDMQVAERLVNTTTEFNSDDCHFIQANIQGGDYKFRVTLTFERRDKIHIYRSEISPLPCYLMGLISHGRIKWETHEIKGLI